MFIDEIYMDIFAGKGGDGIVSWRHEKGIDHAGPGGGDGGKGGDVYVKGVRDISKLSEYRFEKKFKAEDGQNGLSDCMHGKSGKDLILEFPLGTILHNIETNEDVEVMEENPKIILKGGRGGFGNYHFKSSVNINPKEFTFGKEGQGAKFFIELKLVVDLGLVGLPNVGKSSILNSLTKAKAKIGNYQFTTLFPNLGDLYGFVLADIPGLIKGASVGKGLGYKFLRHISRTKAILHCISCESISPISDYYIIRKEMEEYDKSLLNKKEIILLTKTDSVSENDLENIKKQFKNISDNILTSSVVYDKSIKYLSDELVNILKKL